MIRNFFKTAVRNLFKHKIFSFINIFGLAIGIAACLLILQYVSFELSYDHFEKNGSRIFRLQQDRYNDGKLSTQWAAGAAGIGPLVKEAVPEIEAFTRLRQVGGVIAYNDKQFREDKIFFADERFLPMFGYQPVAGARAGLLKDINTAVITKSVASKCFGSQEAVGKMIKLNNEHFQITAVVPDPPVNTHLKFSMLISWPTFVKAVGPEVETTLNWDAFFTYILLKPGADPKQVGNKIAKALNEKYGKEFKENNTGLAYKLQALKDIHLYSNYMFEAEVNGNGRSVYFLLIIAVLIIIIAWINYINLSTARSIDRAREVGIRKVLGSYRGQLISQFLLESLWINLLAVILAFILILIFLPLFNSLTGKGIHFSLLKDLNFWLALAGLFIAGTFLSGLYPAFVLSSFRPVTVLKGKLAKTGRGAYLRQALVILQFAASVVLMVGTIGVYRQLHYMQKQDLGVAISQTLVLKGPSVTDSTYDNKLNAFKAEVLRLPGIGKMTASTEVPGGKVGWNAGGIKLTGSDQTKTNQYRIIGIDYDFLDTYGLKLLKGRNFSTQFSTDPHAVLFNEAAVKLMGFTKLEDALNKRIDFWGEQYTIIGVVSNHHQESLHEAYDAHIFRLIPNAGNYYSLKLTSSRNNWASMVNSVKKDWARFFPGNPFDYFFLDEHFGEQYKDDQQFGKTFTLFAVLAILVSCLGLLGLASFVVTKRTKEIGIRKIVGAGIFNILFLLTKDFIRPVMISFLIALPVTYYLLHKWLENYAFKVSINVWMFILPAFLILVIALVTISTQTVKAASANPVNSLRTE